MNKIFKVVWSKSKECYVVVSEVAKNNGGKKKVLASVLAGLAMVGVAAQMGTPVQAGANNSGNAVNLWADKKLDGSANTANTVGANSVAIGNNLVAGSASTTPTGRLGGTAIAIGVDSQAKDDRDIAIGYNNTTEGQDSFAMGSNVIAGTGQSIAIGSTNVDTNGVATQTIARGKVTMKNGRPEPAAAIAIGVGAQALDGSGVLAMGQLAYAKGNNDVSIGTQTKVIGNNSTAIGSTAQAIGNSSAAFGTQAVANGLGATAVGPGASAGTGDTTATAAAGATAVGRAAQATKEGASALGWAANASVENAAAIGRDTTANIAGGVALGYQSVTTTAAGVQGYNPASDRTNKYSAQAGAIGTSTLAAVSVGNGLTATRQITGLAAGTADTDAVNVAQLKNVNLKYAGDTGNSDVLLKDGTLKVKGDTNFISTSADATGITVTAKIGDPITANTDGKAVAPTTNGLATTTNVADAINASGWKVTSLNNGGTTNGTTSEKVSPGDTVTFSAGKNIVLDQAGKQFTYSLSSTLKDIQSIQNGASKITLNNAGGTTISGGNLSVDGNKITKVAQGTDGTDAVNVDQLNAVAAKERHVKPGNYAVDGNGTVTLNYVDGNNADVADTAVISGIAKDDLSNITNAGKKVITGLGSKVEAGDNVTVTDTTDATTGQKTYTVSANLTKVTDGTNTTVTGAGTTANPYKVNVAGDLTGITSIANTAGGPTMTIGGNSINVTGGNLDLGSNKITNLAPGTNDTDAVNYKQLKAAKTVVEAGTNVSVNKTLGANGEDVYTVSATAGGTASTESVVKKAAATGDTNIADVSVAGGKNVNDPGAQYEVSVSKNAVKDAAREAVTVNNGGNTDNPITVTPTDDAASHNTTYAVTFDGDKAAKQIPLTYKANGSGDKTVKLDKGLDFTNGTNTTAEIGNDGVVKFNLKDTVALTNAGSLTVGDTKVNNDGLTISGGPSVTKNGIDAGNQKITNVAPGTISSTSTDAVNGSQLYDVDQKFNNTVKLTGNAGATDGQALNKANGLSFGVIGADNGKYISTSANGSDVTVDLSTDAKKLLNNTVEVKGKNAATVTTSTETTADGGTKTIYTVDVASTGTVAKSSWNLKSDVVSTTEGTHSGDDTQNIADTKSVTMQAGKNLTVTQTNDTDGNTKVAYSLDKDIDVETVTVSGQNGKDGKIGINGKDGVNGKDNTTRVDIQVEKGPAGVDGTDGNNGTDGMTRIVYEDKNGKQEVATLNDGLKFTGNNESTENNHKLNTLVKVQGEGTKEGTAAGGTKEIQTSDGTKFESAKDNIAVEADGTDTLTVKLNKNLKGLDSVQTKTVELGDHTTSGGTTNITYNPTDKRIEYTTPGATTGTTETKKVATTDDIWTIQGNGTDVKPVNGKVNVKAGDNVVITTPTTADGSMTINAVSPVVYTTPSGEKLTKKSDGKFYKADGTEYTGGDIIASFENPNTVPTGKTSTTDGSMIINNVGSAIKNQTGGDFLAKLDAAANTTTGTPNAAVNVSDLKSTADALKANERHIAPTTVPNTSNENTGGTPNAAGTANVYKYDATNKTVTLTYNDGNGNVVNDTKAVIDFSALNTGGTGASSWNIKSSANTTDGGATGDGHNPAAQNIADTKTVEFKSGKNLVVKQTNDTANGNATVEFSLSDNIVAGKDGANGKDGSVGATGKDGSSVVLNGKDGSIGMTGPKGQDGKDGINGRDGADISMTSAKGEQVLVNRDPAHNTDTDKAERIVYVPKDANGDPIKGADNKNIVREVATMDDGLKFTGNNTTIENKQKLGSLVKVQGEGTQEGTTVINPTTGEKEIVLSDGTTKFESAKDNIAVVADGTDTLTVKLNKNLKGLDSVQTKTVELGDHTTPGGTTNITYNPTDKRIEYTTPGATTGTTETKKVATTDDIWTIQGDGTDVKPVNGKVNVKAGDNVVITTPTTANGSMTISAVSPVVYTTPSGEKLTKKSDGKFYKADGTEYTGGDIIASFENPNTVPAGKTSTTDGSMIINNVGSAIKNQTGGDFLAKLDAAANTTTGTPNAAVNVSDLKSTADALKANERHIAPTTVPNTSNENTGGTPNAAGTANVYKYDATNKTVTLTYNDGNGNVVNDTKAVIDFSALNTGGTGASSWNIVSDKVSATEGTVAAGSAAAQNIADGKTVTMQAGKNLTVNQTNDAAGNASVAFSLDKDLTNLDKVVVNGKDGIAGKDGVTIVGPQGVTGAPGMPGTNGIDGKVGITGKDGKDAVSISGKDGIGTIGLTGPQGPAGQDGRGVDITTDHGTQTLYKPEASNNNQSERIVYVPKDKDGNPLKDTDGNPIKREVATMDDGLKFTGNNESTENKQKLGSLVKVQGEGTKESTAVDPVTGKKYVVLSDGTTKFESAKDNIAVEADGTDTLTVKLNKDLKGLNSIQLGGNTIQSNGDNITFTTNGGTTKTVATTDQLWTIQANGIDVPATNGKVNVVGKDGITVAKNAAGNLEIRGTGLGTMNGFDVTANNSATTKTIKDGNKVDFNATSNLTVKQTSDANGTRIEYSLNKDVDLGNDGSVKTGDTTINNDGFKNGNTTVGGNGMTIKNPADPTKTVSLTKDGLNNGGNQIKNVAPGTDGTDAVNVDQLNQAVAAAASTESVVKKALTGDRNIADISVADGKNTGDKNAKYEVSVSENAVKDAAREAVEVTGSGVIKVTADSTTTPHKTTYDVAYDPDKAADVTKISYKSSTSTDAGSQAPKKTTLADGLDFTSDDNSVAITTGANGKVNFKVDTSGIQGKAFNLDVNKEGTGKVENAQTAAATNSVEKGTKFVAGNNLSIRHDAINGDNKYDHQVTYALNSDLKGITSISNNTTAGGPTMNFGPNELSITGGNLNMGDNKITNVKPGTATTDVATVGQLTKVTSNDNTVAINKTTDADGAPVYDLSVQGGGHDPRVDQLGEEIGRVGAQGAALAALKPIQYDPLEPTQIMAGYGNYRGNSAIAMGVAHYKNESTLMHAGVSWAGGSRHMMANAGVTWKVGNRDSEAAVADRYRKGPISSAYAMQQEMASVKAQNAGLKTEVSDLKAENEQMKAQIAAMMAKLGM